MLIFTLIISWPLCR